MTCLEVVGVAPLRALAPWIRDELVECIVTCKQQQRDVLASSAPGPDLSEVCGQQEVRRVLEIATAGGHYLWLSRPPGHHSQV